MERCGKTDVLDPETGRPLCKLHGEPMNKNGSTEWACRIAARRRASRARRANPAKERERYERWISNHPERRREHSAAYKHRQKLKAYKKLLEEHPELEQEVEALWATA